MARPTTPLLNRDLIRDTALALIDADGLAAFSMRRLARELGVQAPSLYSHFPHRDSVLDAVANRLTAGVDTSGFAGGDWEHGVRVWAHSYRRALVAHPEAAPVVAAGAGDRADYLGMADRVHGGLVAAGWPARRATMIAGAVKFLVMGAATTPFAAGFASDTPIDRERFPHLGQAHRLPEMAEQVDTESFELGVQALIDGLRALHPVAQR